MTYTLAVKILTLLDLIFIAMLSISGSVSGLISELVYYLAFIVPITVGYFFSLKLKLRREEVAGVAEETDRLFKLDKSIGKGLLPIIAPSVAVIFSISLLTSLVLSLFGASTPAVEKTDIITMLLVHALIPAIFEEMLFRYIPMKLIAPYSKRFSVFYSALCFALIHCSFSQMPYAFAAGVLFMAVDVAFRSVWPSVILHFINNAASVVWIKYCDTVTSSLIYIGILILLTLISSLFILKRKAEYRKLISSAFEKGESAVYTPAIIALILICVYFATTNLYV